LFRLYVLLVSVPAVALSVEMRSGSVAVRVPDVFGLERNTLFLLGGVSVFCVLIYRMVVEHHLKRLLYFRALNALRAESSAAAPDAPRDKRLFVLPTSSSVPPLFRLGADYFYEARTVGLANGMLFSVLFFNVLILKGHFDIRRTGLGTGILVFSFAALLIAFMHLVAHSRAARKVERQYWNEPAGIDSKTLWSQTSLRPSRWKTTADAFLQWFTSERFGSWSAALISAVVFFLSIGVTGLVWNGVHGSGGRGVWRFWSELNQYWPFSATSGWVRIGLVLAFFFTGAHITCSLSWSRQRERLFHLASLGYLASYAFFLYPIARQGHASDHWFITSGWPAISFALAGFAVATARQFAAEHHYQPKLKLGELVRTLL